MVDPTTPAILKILAPLLTYEEVVQLHGREYTLASIAKQATTYTQPWECFTLDHKDRLGTTLGFFDTIVDALYDAGYDVRQRTLYAHPDPTVFEPRWDKVEGEFRFRQREGVEMVVEFENGRIDAAPAYGKGTVIRMICQLLPRAKIAVVTKRVAVMHQRLYPELASFLPSVGLVGGGKKIKGRRVMCYTTGSLHHADTDTDLVLVDECHEAAADDASSKFTRFDHAKMFGFSATHGMRLDNKDMRCEALFGPVRLIVTNQEAVREKLILPTQVIWDDVVMDHDPSAGIKDKVAKKRANYWTNRARNKVIKRAAREYDEDTQVLISVETVEHGLHLARMLPEFFFVYGGDTVTYEDVNYYRKQGLVADDWEVITPEQRERWTKKFEQGIIKKAIATTIWNVGVNFTGLSILVRADGGSSPINDTQIPGRPGRINGVKTIATVRDFRDQYNVSTQRRANGRQSSYHDLGFLQIFPNGKTLKGAEERKERERKSMATQRSTEKKTKGSIDIKRRVTRADVERFEQEEDE